MSLREIMRQLLPARSHVEPDPDCAVSNGDARIEPPAAEEIVTGHREYRDQIHRNRNQMTVSIQVARGMERASATALRAANELIEQMQKTRERVH